MLTACIDTKYPITLNLCDARHHTVVPTGSHFISNRPPSALTKRDSEIDGYYGNITQSHLCLWHLGEQLITRGEHTGRTDLHNQRNQFSFSAPQRLIRS